MKTGGKNEEGTCLVEEEKMIEKILVSLDESTSLGRNKFSILKEKCGARNPPTATKCRKCRSKNLRLKKRELVKM